jgi:hypothetical protein
MGACSTNPLLEFRLCVLSTAAPSPIDVHTLWRTHICRSHRRRPIRESRSDASIANRNGPPRSQNGWNRRFSTRSCGGKAAWCCPHSGQAARRAGDGRAAKASKSGELPGVDLRARCPSGNHRSRRVPRMLRKRPSTEVAFAHSSARIRDPESALHILTPEARPGQRVIPRVIRASSTLRPPSTSSWTASSESLACPSHFHAPRMHFRGEPRMPAPAGIRASVRESEPRDTPHHRRENPDNHGSPSSTWNSF